MKNFLKRIFNRKNESTISYDTMTGDKLIIWKFEELVKTLITLSLSANQQKNIIGYGNVAEEMADDFDTYYTLTFLEYIRLNLINQEQKKELDSLDEYFKNHSYEKDPDFWNDDFLDTNFEWRLIRDQALIVLKSLDKDDLEIHYERTVEETKSESGESLMIERTKIILVKKSEKNWVPYEKGKSIGKVGSENGVIIKDIEHTFGARITIEKNTDVAPFSITFGIYSVMFHTEYFSTQESAENYLNLKLKKINQTILHLSIDEGERGNDWRTMFNLLMEELVA